MIRSQTCKGINCIDNFLMSGMCLFKSSLDIPVAESANKPEKKKKSKTKGMAKKEEINSFRSSSIKIWSIQIVEGK